MSYEAWRISFQSSEQAARAAYQQLQEAYTELSWTAAALQAICTDGESIVIDGQLRTVGNILDAANEQLGKQETTPCIPS